VLDLGPGGAEPELEPAAREVVDGDRRLGEHGRVAVRVPRDHAADAHAGRRLGHGREHRPGLEDVELGIAADPREVVEVPAVVEAGIVGDPPDGTQLLGRGSLPRKLEPDP